MALIFTSLSSEDALHTIWIVPAILLFYKIITFGNREKGLPPGPPTVPILGNAHLIPTEGFSGQLKAWAKQYGSIYSLKVGRSTMIVLNDRHAIHELFAKQGAYYNDRPHDTQMIVSARDENPATMREGPKWRATRKMIATFFSPKNLDSASTLRHVQEAEVNRLMFDLLTKPEEFSTSIKRATASIASILLFGQRAPDFDSFWAHSVYSVMEAVSKALSPGSYLPVDQFPILKLLPERWIMGRQRAKDLYVMMTGVWQDARERVDARRSAGDKRDSMLDRIIDGEIASDVPLSYSGVNNLIGGIHQAAADTTATAVLTTILFLAKHPEFQDKARVELDRVCGSTRMPVWSDFDDLPYINCIVKEGLRMRPVAPSGVPHAAKENRWYNGMLIPAGSAIFIPPSALNFDESFTPDPDSYNPDRFLKRAHMLASELSTSPKYEERDHYSYGAGRRMCVGIHLAERSQWRIVAQLLWAFRIEPDIGPDGKPVEVRTGYDVYDEGFLHVPLDYKVRLVPRSEEHANVVKRNFERTEPDLKKWEE
ncbi:cytochrome p450 [Colletotrichum musicola]|uniref:Cytochrome p450 n=1 Tax=Colletotrichum musicola TaxID=2175873 RepID=A0A8H6N7Y3_9PEZI|nr:cytochrome p450 [Colletotrichum musicola]